MFITFTFPKEDNIGNTSIVKNQITHVAVTFDTRKNLPQVLIHYNNQYYVGRYYETIERCNEIADEITKFLADAPEGNILFCMPRD